MKKRVLQLAFFFLCVFLVFAQSVDRKQIKLSDNTIVYVNPGETVFHVLSCKNLGNHKTGMTLIVALEKGYTPCHICVPIKKQPPDLLSKEEVSTSKIDSSLLKKETTEDQLKARISQVGFRECTWGSSEDQVKKSERSEFFQKQKGNTGLDILGYNGNAGGMDCLIAYYFAENQLVEGRYIFIEDHVNKNLYIDDFNKVKSNIVEKYGAPTQDQMIWKNDLYKDDLSDWGTAISAGHLIYAAVWELPLTKISLQLSGDNFKITHVLDYLSIKHKELIEKVAKKAKKDIW